MIPLLDPADPDLPNNYEQAEAKLTTLADEPARAHYEQVMLPLLGALCRRGTGDRTPVELLFVTIGAQPYSPYLAIISIPATHVVLLHTTKTKDRAIQAAAWAGLSHGEVTFADIGAGDDPDQVYDGIYKAWEQRGAPNRIAVDLTSGRKATSAACSAAAATLSAAQYYLAGSNQIAKTGFYGPSRSIQLRDPRDTFQVLPRAEAKRLYEAGNYLHAASHFDAIRDKIADGRGDELNAHLGRVYGYWDVFNLDAARAQLDTLLEKIERYHDLRNHPLRTDAAIAHLRKHRHALSKIGTPKDTLGELTSLVGDAGGHLRTSMLALADRLADRQEYTKASLLYYRSMELAVQARLAHHGLLSNDPNYTQVDPDGTLLRQINSENKRPWTALPDKISLVAGVTILSALNDAVFSQKRFSAGRIRNLSEARNRSLFAHGFVAITVAHCDDLRKLTHQLATALGDDTLSQSHRFLGLDGTLSAAP